MDITKTALILGDSPLLQQYEQYIPKLLTLYFSMGINRIITRYTTSVHIFTDGKIVPLTNAYKDIPTVTIKKYGDLITDKEKELIDVFANKTTNFHKDLENIEVIRNNELAWCGFTHDYAISYLLYKHYDNIVLVGAADFINGPHYSNTENFKRAERLQNHSIQFINEVNNKYAKVFTLNQNPLHNATPITVEELIQGVTNDNRTYFL